MACHADPVDSAGGTRQAALARCRILTRRTKGGARGGSTGGGGGCTGGGGTGTTGGGVRLPWSGEKVPTGKRQRQMVLAKVIRWYRGGEIPAAEKVDGERATK